MTRSRGLAGIDFAVMIVLALMLRWRCIHDGDIVCVCSRRHAGIDFTVTIVLALVLR